MRFALALAMALTLPAWLCAAPVEQRAIWASYREIQSPEAVARTVERCAAAHLNAIYVLVWYNGGTAAYHSTLCPMMKDVPAGHDPLGALIAAAKPKGIDVHAWFVNGSYGWADPGYTFVQHPDWELQTGRKTRPGWYDLGKPEVRAFERDVMLDCLRHYDVAGIHFDYIRFDSRGMCLCDYCQHEVEKRYGVPALRDGGATFPLAAEMSGNPLDKPSTAQVLATFDDGVPALTLNKLGQGEAALLNWQATRTGRLAVTGFVQQMLQRFGVKPGDRVYQLRNASTTTRYGLAPQEESVAWLKGLDVKPVALTDDRRTEVPAGATLVLHAQYTISPEVCAWLEQFVTAGGHALFLDGPVFSIKEAALQRVLGLTGTASYFNKLRTITPAPDQDLLKAGPPVDQAAEQKRAAAWEQFWRGSVSDLVRQVYRGAKALKPRAQVSAAVFYNRKAADSVCQDWYGWLQEGIIDYVLPMAYTKKNEELKAALDEWQAADPTLARIIPGLSIYQEDPFGKTRTRELDLVQAQQDLCRQYKARGLCLFSLDYLDDALTRFLATTSYATPAKPYYPEPR